MPGNGMRGSVIHSCLTADLDGTGAKVLRIRPSVRNVAKNSGKGAAAGLKDDWTTS